MSLPLTSLTAAGLGALMALTSAAEAQRPMEIEDLFDLQQVGSAVVQPGGDHVAYTLVTPRDVVEGEEDGTPQTSLYLTSGPGEGRLYIENQAFGGLDWQGEDRLTFLSRGDGDEATALYEIHLDGGEARKVFEHDSSIQSYAFAPDGETLFFVAREAADSLQSTLRDRGFRANIYGEDTVNSRLWRVDLGEADAEAEMFELDGHVNNIALSDDGSRIAVALSDNPLIDVTIMETDWHIVDAGTGEIVSRIDTPGKIGQGRFSPNGRSFALLAAADRSDPVANTLHVADVQTGALSVVAREAEQHVQDFAWDGNDRLVTLVHSGLQSALVEYRTNGNEARRTAFGDFVANAMDRDPQSRRTAIVADASDHPRELYVSGRRGFDRWTTSNDWLDEIAFGNQRGFEFEARDGVRVEGVLVTPSGDAPEGGWPLIMTVHGGPEAHDSNGWVTGYSRPGHIGAGRGFAVFYPNYRGSTGRGEAFAKLDHQDGPGEEFNDLIDAIQALADEGLVDPDRVGITGGSYGGFASAWGATIASEHFAASVPFVALTDLISFWGTTEIPVEMVDVHFMQYPWENWQSYLEHSPIRHAQGSTTPTLILHGEADTRVDPSQSYELYNYLKMAGEAPVRLVTYPGEGHGNRNAAAQYDYALRMMRWMEHYLQGEGGEPPAHELPYRELLGLGD